MLFIVSCFTRASFAKTRAMVKVKVHTLDIAPLRSESPPQKRSGMARVLKDFTLLPAHPHVHPQSE